MATLERVHQWTREEYERLSELGLPGFDRTELLDGQIIDKISKNQPHVRSLKGSLRALEAVFGPSYDVRSEAPLGVGSRGLPEPDLCVVPGDYLTWTRHPEAAEAVLVVEICDNTVREDRRRKLPLYLSAGVPEVWLVDLTRLKVERHRPDQEVQTYGSGETIGSVKVDDLLAQPIVAEPPM